MNSQTTRRGSTMSTWGQSGRLSSRMLGPNSSMCERARSGLMWELPDLGPVGKRTVLVEWQTFPDQTVDPRFVERLAGELKALGVGLKDDLFFICRSGSRSWAAAKAMLRQATAIATMSVEASKGRSTTIGIAGRWKDGRRRASPGSKARVKVSRRDGHAVRVDLVDCSCKRRAVRNGANKKNGKEQEPWHSKSRGRRAKLGRGSRVGYAQSSERMCSRAGSGGSSSKEQTARSSILRSRRASSAIGSGRITTTSC